VCEVGRGAGTAITVRGPIMGRSRNETAGGRNLHHHVGYAPGIPALCDGDLLALRNVLHIPEHGGGQQSIAGC
jgi:hypothetical protein